MDEDEFDDVEVLTRMFRTIPGGRRQYGYRAMAEKILDMLDAEDIVLTRRPSARESS